MSDLAAVVERVVATVAAVSPRGTATAVLRETRAVVSAVARQGVPGPPGRDGGGAFQVLAGMALSGHRVVRPDANGRAIYASCLILADAASILGITDGAADLDMPVTIVSSGEVVQSSWAWSPGRPVWLGEDGALVQPAPAVGDLRHVGVALAPTRLFVTLGSFLVRNS